MRKINPEALKWQALAATPASPTVTKDLNAFLKSISFTCSRLAVLPYSALAQPSFQMVRLALEMCFVLPLKLNLDEFLERNPGVLEEDVVGYDYKVREVLLVIHKILTAAGPDDTLLYVNVTIQLANLLESQGEYRLAVEVVRATIEAVVEERDKTIQTFECPPFLTKLEMQTSPDAMMDTS